MSSLRNPVGRLPSRVYWRRRIVVLLGLVAVIAAVVLIIVRPGQAASTPPAPTQSAGSDSAPQTPPDPTSGEPADEEPVEEQPIAAPGGTPAACTAGSVRVEAVTDVATYGPQVRPQLSLTITNITSVPCVLQAGTDVQEFRITSGNDLIWSSRHCQQDPQPVEVVLAGNETLSTTPLEWSRERSTPDTCEAEREPVVAGGASYHLSVQVGDFDSASTKQFILL